MPVAMKGRVRNKPPPQFFDGSFPDVPQGNRGKIAGPEFTRGRDVELAMACKASDDPRKTPVAVRPGLSFKALICRNLY